jgi:protein SCO1/2
MNPRLRLAIWLLVFIASAGAFAAHKLSANQRDETTHGDFGRVPAFSLTDQRGRVVTPRDYAGKVWVASFVFTRCPSVCPLLTAKMASLQKRLGSRPNLRFVSISVDPEHDTPQVLAQYAQKFGADPERWRFLTGPLADIERTVVKGFKIHMGQATPHATDPTLVEIMHGEHFVLVDAQGTIRGYFPTDQAGLAELEQAVDDLERVER